MLATARARALGLIGAAVALHLALTGFIFVVGRYALMPNQFSHTGVGEFAFDGYRYGREIDSFTDSVARGKIGESLNAASYFHVKLYALSAVLFKPFSDFNILVIEPLNILFYLAILILVFKIASQLFDRRAALIASTITALWPTLLLHTTQPLKEALIIVAMLIVILMICQLLIRVVRIRQAILIGVIASAAICIIWIVKPAMWNVVRATMAVGFIFFCIRQWREKRMLILNMLMAAVFIAMTIFAPLVGNAYGFKLPNRFVLLQEVPLGIGRRPKMSFYEKLTLQRRNFIGPNEQGKMTSSNMDTDVTFRNAEDVLRYLPRAAAIGFFAPFPNMWTSSGTQVGSAGRMLSGVEMLVIYMIEILAVVGLWSKRKNLATWLLAFSVVVGVTSLGVVLVNVGALYRMRYPFMILLVILGSGGISYLTSRISCVKFNWLRKNLPTSDRTEARSPVFPL